MATHKQQKYDMVINRWELFSFFSPRLLLSIELCRQQVTLSVFLAIFLAQSFTFNHHQALKSLVFSLAECRHFQGSWFAPRRSGSQATKFWLMVDFRKLGHMQESLQVGEDAQKFVEKTEFEETEDEGCSGTRTFFLSWECISRIGWLPCQTRVPSEVSRIFPRAIWLDLAESFLL